jgi:hypothetical protein
MYCSQFFKFNFELKKSTIPNLMVMVPFHLFTNISMFFGMKS